MYISVTEAAERWGVSVRQVQRLLGAHRIPGAKRHGRAWMIPVDAQKPQDLRKERAAEKRFQTEILSKHTFLPLVCGEFGQESIAEAVEQMEDDALRQMARAEYCYYSGQMEQTLKLTAPFLEHDDLSLRLSALFMHAFASLMEGRLIQFDACFSGLMEICGRVAASDSPTESRALGTLFTMMTIVKLRGNVGDLPAFKQHICHLSPGMQLYAYYICTYCAYQQGDYGEALGIVKTALCIYQKEYAVARVYLHLMMAITLIRLKRTEEAKQSFMTAWQIAQKEHWIMPLSEHHGLLHGMTESCLKRAYPKDYEQIIRFARRYNTALGQSGKSSVGKTETDSLSAMEISIASLILNGWTNAEMADFFNLSIHTVKKYISDMYEKLDISSRRELRWFVSQK